MSDSCQYETEEGLQAAIIELAEGQGWAVYHTRNSKGSNPGFTDLVLVRELCIFAEIKTMTGRLSKGRMNRRGDRWQLGQDDWRRVLLACPGVVYKLWRPCDWPEIADILTKPWMGTFFQRNSNPSGVV